MRIVRQLRGKLKDYWLKDVSFLLLFVFLFLNLFVFSPMIDELKTGELLYNVSLMAILFSGVWSVKKSVFRFIGGLLFVMVLVFKILRLYEEIELFYNLELIIIILYLIYLIKTNFALLFRDYEVNFYRIIGAVNVYLLFALVGAYLFLLMEIIHPGNFSNSAEIDTYETGLSNFIYFSLVSISTVGYGEMYPEHSFARSLSVFIAVLGLLYPTLVIARLITLELQKK